MTTPTLSHLERMRPFLLKLNYPYILTHELCHFIPAKILRMNPKIDMDDYGVSISPAPLWQNIIVGLAPTAVGVVLLLMSILAGLGSSSFKNYLDAFAVFSIALGWLAGCRGDWQKLLILSKNS